MKETQDLTKMEFVIKLNDNIVVQRFFNVKGYNETAKYSLELHDYMKDIADYMERYLKDKLKSLTDIFSGENFSTQYMNYQLA